MCGIGGIFHGEASGDDLSQILDRLAGAMVHRGPDDSGSVVDGPLAAGLTCRRLSLIGVHDGHQPIDSEDGMLSLVANCEIYNHRQLGRRLEASGHRFKTSTDAEVILHLYEDEGVDGFSALNGMFAMVILDRRHKRLVMARDRSGMKQLYHTSIGRTFLFASEAKALFATGLVDAEPDWDAIDTFLAVGFVPAPRSCFKNIHKLEAGTYLVVDGQRARRGEFWHLRYQPDTPARNDYDYAQTLGELLRAAVASHLDAESPVGVFLSGGWDSSLVASMAAAEVGAGLPTFSIVMPEYPQYDEGGYARTMAAHIRSDHHEVEFRSSDIPALLHEAVWFREEPFTGPAILEFQLAEMASRHVKAVLAGQGSDELFGGYPWLQRDQAWYRGRRFVPSALANGLGDRVTRGRCRLPLRVLGSPDDVAADIEFFRKLNPREKDLVIRPGLRVAHPDIGPYRPHPGTLLTCRDHIQRRMSIDFTRRLTDGILVTNDRMAMAHGLEVRLPFLDGPIIEFASSLPTSLKVRDGQEKYVLSLLTGRLPAEIANRRKFGLQYPLRDLLLGPLRSFVDDALLDDRASEIFNRPALQKLLPRWLSGPTPNLDAPWSLVVLRVWWEQFFGRSLSAGGAQRRDRKALP